MVLNGLWLVTARYLNLIATVIVIAALLAVLARIIVMLGRERVSGLLDLTLFDGVQGLHLGWVTIATVANAAAWLTQTVPAELGRQADSWGIGVLVVVAVIGAASALLTRRLAPALATSWGLIWAAVGRLSGEPESTPIGVTALIVAGVILVAGVAGLLRSRRAAR
ncbi:hypothetical protein AB0N64_09000 [Microbacterium sp. NPDC089318]